VLKLSLIAAISSAAAAMPTAAQLQLIAPTRVRGHGNRHFIGNNNPPIVCFPTAGLSLDGGYGRKGATMEEMHERIMGWAADTPFGLYIVGQNTMCWHGTDLENGFNVLNEGSTSLSLKPTPNSGV